MRHKIFVALMIIFSIITFGNVYAENNVFIESVTLESKSDTVSLAEAKYEGLSVNLNVKFGYVNEYAKFKILVNNKTDQKYELNLQNNNSGKYLIYNYEYDNNIINPKETKTVYVTITYKNEIPITETTNEVYSETKSAVLDLSTKSTIIDVPITFKNKNTIMTLLFISWMIVAVIMFLYSKHKISTLVILLLLIPTMVYAIEKIELKIVSNATIELKTATLKPGPEINVIFKKLAGNGDIDYTFYDENVKDFKRSFTKPSGGIETKVISTDDSGYEVIAWFDNGTLYWYSEANKVFLNENASRMFDRLSAVENVEIKYFDSSKVTTFLAFFQSNFLLKEIDLSTLNTSKVEDFSAFFNKCYSLVNIKGIEDLDVSNATQLGGFFGSCASLTELHLEKWDTSKVFDMQSMFHNCVLLEELDLNNWDVSNVKYMARMFNAASDSPTQTWGNMKVLKIDQWDMSSMENMIWFLDTQTTVTTEFTIRSTNIKYTGLFNQAADAGGQITVNYTRETESLVDSMIASKSVNSNVIKGRCVDCEG